MSVNVDQLGFSYRRVPALRAISAVASPGRITAVIGPNASGKSTLLRCIIGALRPHTGHVLIAGRIAHRTSPRRMARLAAYVPQRSTVSAAFSVRQVVELGRYALPANRSRVEDAISKLDLNDVAERPFSALSVGQQHRVTLARAVAQLEPDGVLVLDEPTAAMDLSHSHQTMSLLRELALQGATVIMAVHDVNLAAAAADDVWVLQEGQTRGLGPCGSILDPRLLQEVFGVSFRWVESDGAGRVLITQSGLQSFKSNREDRIES